MLVETHFGCHRFLPTQALHSPFAGWTLRLYAASGRAGAARYPRNLRWNPVRFRLALHDMMNVMLRTSIRERPEPWLRKKPYAVPEPAVLPYYNISLLVNF